MSRGIPSKLDPEFLDWFRDRTETCWASLPIQTLDEILADFVEEEVGGEAWQRDTRWLAGLDEQDIAKAEERWQLRFPPDYRLFLERLHAPDRPSLRAGFVEKLEPSAVHPALARAHVHTYSDMVLHESASFYNWSTDRDSLNGAFNWLAEGLEFDIEHEGLWQPSWGSKPTTLERQRAQLRATIEKAPKLIPVYGHRYLLGEPCAAGNPVLSVYQSDVIVYAADLHDYFLVDFMDLLGLSFRQKRKVSRSRTGRINDKYESYTAIPFWGELL